jgi:hypothetical protein
MLCWMKRIRGVRGIYVLNQSNSTMPLVIPKKPYKLVLSTNPILSYGGNFLLYTAHVILKIHTYRWQSFLINF